MSDEKRYYMACLDLRGRAASSSAAGGSRRRRCTGLLDCGARVTVVAPHIDD